MSEEQTYPVWKIVAWSIVGSLAALFSVCAVIWICDDTYTAASSSSFMGTTPREFTLMDFFWTVVAVFIGVIVLLFKRMFSTKRYRTRRQSLGDVPIITIPPPSGSPSERPHAGSPLWNEYNAPPVQTYGPVETYRRDPPQAYPSPRRPIVTPEPTYEPPPVPTFDLVDDPPDSERTLIGLNPFHKNNG